MKTTLYLLLFFILLPLTTAVASTSIVYFANVSINPSTIRVGDTAILEGVVCSNLSSSIEVSVTIYSPERPGFDIVDKDSSRDYTVTMFPSITIPPRGCISISKVLRAREPGNYSVGFIAFIERHRPVRSEAVRLYIESTYLYIVSKYARITSYILLVLLPIIVIPYFISKYSREERVSSLIPYLLVITIGSISLLPPLVFHRIFGQELGQIILGLATYAVLMGILLPVLLVVHGYYYGTSWKWLVAPAIAATLLVLEESLRTIVFFGQEQHPTRILREAGHTLLFFTAALAITWGASATREKHKLGIVLSIAGYVVWAFLTLIPAILLIVRYLAMPGEAPG